MELPNCNKFVFKLWNCKKSDSTFQATASAPLPQNNYSQTNNSSLLTHSTPIPSRTSTPPPLPSSLSATGLSEESGSLEEANKITNETEFPLHQDTVPTATIPSIESEYLTPVEGENLSIEENQVSIEIREESEIVVEIDDNQIASTKASANSLTQSTSAGVNSNSFEANNWIQVDDEIESRNTSGNESSECVTIANIRLNRLSFIGQDITMANIPQPSLFIFELNDGYYIREENAQSHPYTAILFKELKIPPNTANVFF